MDHEKKLELLKELDSTTDWQALINAREEATKSKSQVVPQKPTRKLTKGEKKRKRMQHQLEHVKKATMKKNVQTVVYNNPDSKLAKANRSMRNSELGGQLAPTDKAPEEGVELDMRKARHEIIKFGMSSLKSKDLEDAEASLAISLGARPKKRPAMNYRELQAQRKQEKESEKEMEANFSKPSLGSIVKKKSQQSKRKVGSKPKAGHGRSNNGNNSRHFSKQSRRRKD